MTSYTSGAMRAAERIASGYNISPDFSMREKVRHSIAAIITEETGDADLIAALEMVEAMWAKDKHDTWEPLKQVRAAIARARGEQP